MPRHCTVCGHSAVEEVNRAIVSGTGSIRDVARRFGLSAPAVDRHKHHLARIPAARRLAGVVVRREERQADKLDDLVFELREDARRLLAKAEEAKDYRTAIAAVRELARLAELGARANGELRAPSSGSTTNVLVNVARPLTEEEQAQARREVRILHEFYQDEERERQAFVAQGVQAP
jgi:hypothetical protein